MKATIRLPLALLLLLAPRWPAPPRLRHPEPPPDPMAAIRADRWADAQAAAAQYADPVATKLVTYYRLLAPGAATAQEIADFVASSPDWPAQAALERRRQEAVANDPDDAAVLAQCDQGKLTVPAARLRCANALANAGRNDAAAAEARRAWIAGFPDPAGFPQRWRSVQTPADQWDRFQGLAWSDATAAARQVPLLDPPQRAGAEARLAMQRDAPDAAARLAAVPPAFTNDPGLMLEQARWLRRAERIAEANALWRARGAAAQQAAPAAQLPAFWAERERLARRLLHDGNAADAYGLVVDPGPIPARQALDADFLAGFIALRLLHQPDAATRHFQALAAGSPAAITQGRAWYWLGRAAAATPDARAAYAKAAAWSTTFYGQLAAVAVGDDPPALATRVNALRDPQATREQAFGLTQREVVRAAALLAAWGEPHRAEAFLLRMDELAPDLPDRALTAQLSLALRQPQTAVAIARRMGRDGVMLPQSGWPVAVDPPTDSVDTAVSLGLIRQESSFDSGTISPAGARGIDAAHARHRGNTGAPDRCHNVAGRTGVRSAAEHAPGHGVCARVCSIVTAMLCRWRWPPTTPVRAASISGWRRTATRASVPST